VSFIIFKYKEGT